MTSEQESTQLINNLEQECLDSYLVGLGPVTVDNRCVRYYHQSLSEGRTHKRFDFDCMIIVDIHIKSLERMLMSTG